MEAAREAVGLAPAATRAARAAGAAPAAAASNNIEMMHELHRIIGADESDEVGLYIQGNPYNDMKRPLLDRDLSIIGLPTTSYKQFLIAYGTAGTVGALTSYSIQKLQPDSDEGRILITMLASTTALLLAGQRVGINIKESGKLIVGAVSANVVGELAGRVLEHKLGLNSSTSNPYGTHERIVFATIIGVSAGALVIKSVDTLFQKCCNPN